MELADVAENNAKRQFHVKAPATYLTHDNRQFDAVSWTGGTRRIDHSINGELVAKFKSYITDRGRFINPEMLTLQPRH